MKPSIQRIAELNKGLLEARTLMDSLAIDMNALVAATFPEIQLPKFVGKVGITKKMQQAAQAFYEQKGFDSFHELKAHRSDTLRGLACYVLSYHSLSSWEEKFELILPLADDLHSGVREWAWLALRPICIAHPFQAIEKLAPLVKHPSERIRRFVSEITRPRGVWCSHIAELRKEPWKALILLEPMNNDPAKYVQLSVANWLNDAGKDHPEWVVELCRRWKKESPTDSTGKICKRALRNLN